MEGCDANERMREEKIQVALDLRRSESWTNTEQAPLSLPEDEEEDLEGKAGDSGSARGDVGDANGQWHRRIPSYLTDSSSAREARIEGALNFRRSGSLIRVMSNRNLSQEEEDELEGKAGDSGSMRHTDDEMSGSVRPTDDEMTSEARISQSAHVVPVNVSPSPTREKSNEKLVPSDKLHGSLECVSILAYLTTFGIIGVCVRYLLEILFGHQVANVTADKGALFLDLPANMVGSFFMGWVGVVFKKDIAIVSENLAVGLSTGLMGSITTYAAMMQRLLETMVAGEWVAGFCGLLIGMELAQMSLTVGVDSALLLLRILKRVNENRDRKGSKKLPQPPPESLHQRKIGLIVFVLLGGSLWSAAGVLTAIDKNVKSRRTLWMACLVAPPGVWVRWYLARLNGGGIGPEHRLRWFPVGTFIANFAASSIEAGLSVVLKATSRYFATLFVSGIQLGTLGCLSTVSTFVAEIQIMSEGRNRWRAYVYPFFTITVSLVIGILVYGIPVWVLGYAS